MQVQAYLSCQIYLDSFSLVFQAPFLHSLGTLRVSPVRSVWASVRSVCVYKGCVHTLRTIR